MKRWQRIGLGLTLAVALAVHASAAAYTCHAIQYQDVIPESSIQDANYASQGANYPSGVNDRGDTVGTYQICNEKICVEHGVLRFANGTVVSIQYPKSNGTSARSINNSGQIVGTFTDAKGLEHGYMRNADGKFLQIDPPAQFSGDALQLWGISDKGNLLGVIHPPTDSQDDSQWHSFVRDTQGDFSVFRWRACCSEGHFRTAGINDSKDYVLWGDFQIYHSDGGSTPISFPLYTSPWAVYGIDNEGEVVTSATYYSPGDELPLLRNTKGNFPIIDCQSILPSKRVITYQVPSAISGNGTVAGTIFYYTGDTGLDTHQVAFIGLPQSGQPALEGLPKSVKFPLTPVNNESDITIKLGNGGNAPLSLRTVISENREDFSALACPDEVTPGQTCGVKLTYHPFEEEKTATGPVVLYDNTPDGPHIIQLSGSARIQSLQFSRDNWTFSGHPVGETSGPGTIWIYNTGPWKVTFSKIYFAFGNNGDFKVTKDLCTGVLFAYHTCSVSFDFTPTTVGGRNSVLEFDNDFNFNNFAKVRGVGEGKSLQFSNTSWMFGTRQIGQATGPATIYIYNNGTEPVAFSRASVGGANPADFQVVRDTCSGIVQAYHTCGVKFTFQPTAAGMRTAALLLNNNSPSSPQIVRLSGTAN